MILFFIFSFTFVLYGYFIDKWLGGCGLAICGITGLMACLIDMKDEIVKAIDGGVKTDE
jgi:hypothetical protein